jgi:type II secretion system protein H
VKVRKNRGFTLMELLIVIALIVIVTAIASANFKNYRDRTNMREAAREISADIQHYKQRAVSESVPYSITFNAGANNYTIQRDGTTVVTKSVGKEKVPVSINGTPSFSPGGTTTLELYTRGTTGNGTIELKHVSPKVKNIQITTSSMGKVSVK